MIYLTADQHFGHKNIIKYSNRPFSSVEDMDQRMLDNINRMVGPNDILYILGDFTMGSSISRNQKYRDQIICNHVYLIRGNHDKQRYCTARTFQTVKEYHVIAYAGTHFYLYHFPDTSIVKSPLDYRHFDSKDIPNTILCHGHSHYSKMYNDTNRKKGRLLFDVGVDANNYRPVSVNDILEFFTINHDS